MRSFLMIVGVVLTLLAAIQFSTDVPVLTLTVNFALALF